MSKNVPIPFLDRVIVTKKKPETKSAGGIIIPESALEKENEGFVVAIGPLVGKSAATLSVPTDVHPQVGDHVIFGEYAGTKVKVETDDGEEYVIMREADILCKK